MNHKILRPFIVKVSTLGYFPLLGDYLLRIMFLQGKISYNEYMIYIYKILNKC